MARVTQRRWRTLVGIDHWSLAAFRIGLGLILPLTLWSQACLGEGPPPGGTAR